MKSDQVGIVGLSLKWRHLYFYRPGSAQNVAFIPLTSNSALAARTARKSRPEINNNFTSARHATVFEDINIRNDSAEAIHTIISAPILSGNKVVGVISDQPQRY